MKYFKDKNNKIFAFEDDAPKQAIDFNIKKFGLTEINEDQYTQLTAPTLDQVKNIQISDISTSFTQAITADIVFTTKAGVKQTFQADKESQAEIQKKLQIYATFSGVPKGFFWVAKDNTPVAFTLSDLKGLNKAIGEREWRAFEALQKTKTAIRSAQSVEAVQSNIFNLN
jgi:hypothetical protein